MGVPWTGTSRAQAMGRGLTTVQVLVSSRASVKSSFVQAVEDYMELRM